MNASFWNYPSKQKSWPIDEEMESLGEVIHPLDNIGGFDVRPGFYQMNGAYQTEEGVSFTVSSHGALLNLFLVHQKLARPELRAVSCCYSGRRHRNRMQESAFRKVIKLEIRILSLFLA